MSHSASKIRGISGKTLLRGPNMTRPQQQARLAAPNSLPQARAVSPRLLYAAKRLHHDLPPAGGRTHNNRRPLPKLPVTTPLIGLPEVIATHLRQNRGALDAQPIPRILINLFSQGEI